MKNIVKLTTHGFVVFSSLFIFATFANAEDLPSRGPIPFATYDTNNDGFVSEQEFYDARAKRVQERVDEGMPMRNAGNAPDFSEFDTNGDGKLTELELVKGQNAQMQNKKQNKGYGQGMKQGGMGQGMGKGMN